MIVADALARWHRLIGDDVLFLTGTDEHGLKIARSAEEHGVSPKEWVDQASTWFLRAWADLGITQDDFIRTTDERHTTSVAKFVQTIFDNGFIYKGDYAGWYCVSCENYYVESDLLEGGRCPIHETPAEWVTEENYFFALSKFQDRLTDWYERNPSSVLPESRRNEALGLIRQGLGDFSISRTSFDWGIPVPWDDRHVFYVWFEALMNYITVLGYPENSDFEHYWPASIQVIGKDIIRFHAAIWPAMLLSLGLDLPKVLYVHGFLNIDGKKMSKTLGNYIAPSEIIEEYGADALRYYLLRHIPSYSDGDFSRVTFEASYNNELANELGNALNRTLAMINNYLGGEIGAIPPPEHDIAGYQRAIEECRFDRALDEVWAQVRGLNQYIDETKPWVLAKSDDKDHLREVLAYQVGSLLEVAELLGPFMPETALKIKNTFKSGKISSTQATLFPKKDQPK